LRADLAGRLLRELEQHMQVEEELFYPAVERAAALGHALRHARHEHDAIRERIAQVAQVAQAGSDGGALGEAIDALEASVAQHVREEEAELFPQVDGIALDWTEVGIAIAGRREQLRGGPAP
ncbi:MAG TPA: hemerythrin domain-containing protein, partial [Xanthomonadales bacterium]|nr:hemerythrin domain-containing protein [Xanthomonadales bacterium]